MPLNRSRGSAPSADRYKDDNRDDEPRRSVRRGRDDDDRDRDRDRDEDRSSSRRGRGSRDRDDEPRSSSRGGSRRGRDDDRAYEKEDENERPSRSSRVPASGWEAADKIAKETKSGEFAPNFEFGDDGDDRLVAFLDDGPFAAYAQHFVRELPKGQKKSFLCLEPYGDECPLCTELGYRVDALASFNIVPLDSEDGEVEVQQLTVRPRAKDAIKKAGEKDGPLTATLWLISRTGEGFSSFTHLKPVKRRDLQEDFGLDPEDVDRELANLVPFTAEVFEVPTKRELQNIVDALN